MSFVRNSLALAMLCGLFLVGCDGLSVDTVRRVAADTAGSGDTGTAADDTTDDTADTAVDTAVDTAPDTIDSADTTDTTDTGVAVTNACGGTEPLAYRGNAAGPGDGCGLCGDGELYCSGTSGLSCAGASLPNGCGGCGLVEGEIGTTCGLCGDGVWACGAGQSECVGDRPPNGCGGCTTLALEPGTECALATGDAGVVVCSGRELSRCASAGTNGCGGTAPLALPAGVTGVEPRPGVLYQTDCRRGVLLCDGTALVAVDLEGGNACGGCDPLLGEPGAACGACGGVWTCDAEGAVRCIGGNANACGGCAALDAGPGRDCDAGGNAGVTVCISLEETACVAPGSTNACGGLGTITGDPLGQSCGACADGAVACDATDALRRSTVCEGATDLNSCGGCGLLDGTVGSPCGTCGSGSFACSATSLVCINDAGAAAENVCGGCSTLAASPGDPCGRCGTWSCDLSATGRLRCDEPAGGCGTVAVCGNGAVEAAEECDDDGIIDGDGCSRSCVVESGYDCVGSPSSCSTVCGDGLLVGAEVCDEGDANGAGSCSVGCTCSAGYHLEGGVCTSDERACSVTNGTGTETWTGSSYGPCVATACASAYHVEISACASDTRSCSLANATAATQTWNNATSTYGTCIASACATSYHVESGVCTSDTRSCTIPNGTGSQTYAAGSWGTCGVVSCDSAYHAAGNACDTNVISCTLSNATAATQTWNSVTGAYGTCTATACTAAYHIESGACVSDTRSCSLANATAATQTWTGSAYGTCTATACTAGYHVESGACASDTRSCSLANATAATQTWTGSAYGTCTATACASGYTLSGSVCVTSGGLGAACTLNAECASGFCATGPSGTANDRCAPTGMNYIPAGTFTMGSPSVEVGRYADETQHSVTISRSFFMGLTEVTQGQWKALSGGINPSYFQSTTGTGSSTANANDSGPAENLDWYAAVAFANARSASEGLSSCYTLTGCTDAANGWKDGIHSGCTGATFSGLACTGYRLPTESEWEYAARGGTTAATYLGNLSATFDFCNIAQANLDGIAWWCGNSGSRTQAVGGRASNAFGLFDMLGNVYEWTGDLLSTYGGPVIDPTGGTVSSIRVSRGGSWYFSARYARAAGRSASPPDSRGNGNDVGFRLARTAFGPLPLGAACTANAECASGFCATGPDGTANDRCAPEGMNYTPSGSFLMGSPETELGRDTTETQHSVTITRSFFMGLTEVTQGQWKALSGGVNPSCFQSATGAAYECTIGNAYDSGPVEYLDWYAAVAFANARSAAEGLTACYTLSGCYDAANGWKDGSHSGCNGAIFSGLTCTGYRLPTESEWEYAARGGTTTATYLGNLSGTVTDCTTAQAILDGIAWWCSNSGNRTKAVGGKTANSFGLSDMLGNVYEWTGDWYGTYPGTVIDPLGPATGSSRVPRGGSFATDARNARAANRYVLTPDFRTYWLGLRLARTAP